MKDYYKILGITERASENEIKNAYKNLINKYQPDNFSGEAKKLVLERIEDIKEAYSVLSDEFLRSQFNKEAGFEPRIDIEITEKQRQKNKRARKTKNEEENYYQPNNYREEFYNQEDYEIEEEISFGRKKKKKKIDKRPEVGSTADLMEITKAVFKKLREVKVGRPTKKGILSMLGAIAIVVLILLILWLIPFTRGFVQSLFIFQPR